MKKALEGLLMATCVACGGNDPGTGDIGSDDTGFMPGGEGSGGASVAGSGGAGSNNTSAGTRDASTDSGTANHSGSGGGGSDAGSSGDTGTPIGLTRPPYDWVGVIGTGQSLSVGATSVAVSLTQPYKNLMLIDDGPEPRYPIDGRASAVWKLVPLTEPHRPNVPGTVTQNLEYPNNICGNANGEYGETPHSGMANTISKAWAARGNTADYITTHTVVGVGGYCIVWMAKGSHSYASALSEARVYTKLADQAGKVYGVGAVVLTHGECDTSERTADYGEKVYKLWQDYNADFKAITKQPNDIVLLASQQSSIPGGYTSSSVQLWRAGRAHPGQVVCTGPKYAFGDYYVHMKGPSYERIGEKYGEVFDLIVNQGVAWKPLGPNRLARQGKVITIDFDVPNPPMVWDQDLAKPHQTAHQAWAAGNGFEVVDSGGREIQIASAEIAGSSVKLTLAQEPAADARLTVAYGLTQDTTGEIGGTAAGMHGLLRDSDSFQGYASETIQIQVTNGSTTAKGTANALARIASLDFVSGGSLQRGTVVKQIAVDTITLSQPWTGASGNATLTFNHNHYNYCVHFVWDLP